MIKDFIKSQRMILGMMAFTMLIVICLYVKHETTTNMYSQTMIVTNLLLDDDSVVLTDANGNDWTFQGIEDWYIGDVASVLMNNNGTLSIYDDSIIKARYSGFTRDFDF